MFGFGLGSIAIGRQQGGAGEVWTPIFPASAWVTNADATVTAGQADPNGGTGASSVIESTSPLVPHGVVRTGTATLDLVSGKTYRMWAIAKAIGTRHLGLQCFSNDFASTIDSGFFLTTGLFNAAASSNGVTAPFSAAVRSGRTLGNGWCYCEHKFTMTGSLTAARVYWSPHDAAHANVYTGDGVSGMYLYRGGIDRLGV
jgi:hypothetical protein